MARPTKLTVALIEQAYKEIKEGLPVEYTCDLLGITRVSFNNWMKLGEEDFNNEIDSLNAEFFSSIKKAYAEFVKESKMKIHSGDKGWQGVCWWLERTNPKFMPKQEVSAGEDGKVTVVLGGHVKEVKKNG